jgi:hypothetical protein
VRLIKLEEFQTFRLITSSSNYVLPDLKFLLLQKVLKQTHPQTPIGIFLGGWCTMKRNEIDKNFTESQKEKNISTSKEFCCSFLLCLKPILVK